MGLRRTGLREAPASKSNQVPEPYVEQDTTVVLGEPLYALFNHNSETWDPERCTFEATRRLAGTVSEHNIPVISIVEDFIDDHPVDNHFLNEEHIDYPVRSSNGRHRLLFPRLKGVVLSGGYLEYCFRRAIEDIYRGASFYRVDGGREPVRLYLVADAIYVCGADITVELDKERSTEPSEKPAFTLRRAMALMSDDALAAYLEEKFLNIKGKDSDEPDRGKSFNPEEVHIRIFRGDYNIHTVGDGRLVIDVMLVDTTLLDKRLSSIVAWASGES